MSMLIKDFPEELRFKLKLKAFEAGVTLRELVISVLEEWEGGRLKMVAGLVAGGAEPRKQGVTPPGKVREKFENPVITDEHINRLSKMPAKPASPAAEKMGELGEEWEPEKPQVSNPWDGAYDKIRGGRKKP